VPLSRRSRRPMVWGGALATLAAAAALVLLVRAPEEPAFRTKGGLQLQLIARRANGRVEAILPGGELAPGEALRFRVTSRAAGCVCVSVLDSARVVSAYVPAEGQALAFPATRERLLDGSIILDETLGPERVVAVLCKQPIAVAEVVAAGKRALARANG